MAKQNKKERGGGGGGVERGTGVHKQISSKELKT